MSRPTLRAAVIAVTAVSLVGSFVLSAVWFVVVSGPGRFEPSVQSLGLLAGITGLIAERRLATLERRDQALAAVRIELDRNRETLAGFTAERNPTPRREIYPRVYTSAVSSALASSALPPREAGLARELEDWRDRAATFNQQLSIAESLAFMVGSDDLLRELHEALYSADGPAQDLKSRLEAVLARLA